MQEHPHTEDELVTIAEFGHEFEAEMARIALENEGIEATIVGGDLVANMPTIEDIKIQLQVFEKDVERAEQVLAAQAESAESLDDSDDEEQE
ncbi:MAG: DUF2007 domain-containing protein [Sedimentisphaerales bacterium]|nr:DUF2007 domain-containing protein [Sedimentisphaerales bacterium]